MKKVIKSTYCIDKELNILVYLDKTTIILSIRKTNVTLRREYCMFKGNQTSKLTKIHPGYTKQIEQEFKINNSFAPETSIFSLKKKGFFKIKLLYF